MIAIEMTGKTAVVTGGGSGIGAAAVTRFHAAGANVVIDYFDDPARANRAKAEALASSLGERAMCVVADVCDGPALAKMVDRVVERFGGIDYVINNAGIIRDRTLMKMDDADWDAVISTNLTGVYRVCKAAVEKMRDGGAIVNISSISASLGTFGQLNYVAAKAGVMGMTRVLSRELAKRRIRVNAVAPGLVDTDIIKGIPPERMAAMLAQIPLARLAKPTELADVILLLCSDLMSYVTGQTIHVNGGWLAP